MVVAVGMNPALDRILIVPGMAVGETLKAREVTIVPSGKGANVAAVMHLLGVPVRHTGFLGREQEPLYQHRLRGVPCEFALVDGTTRTDTTIIDPDTGSETHIREPGFEVSPAAVDAFIESLLRSIDPGDVVTLSGSLPPGAPGDTYARIIRRCREAGAQTFLDSSGIALQRGALAAPTLMKPNEVELAELAGHALGGVSDVVAACATLLDRGVEAVAVSLGEGGGLLAEPGEAWFGPAIPTDVVNTVGCGDAFACGWLAARLAGRPAREQLEEALAVGAANAMTNGAGIIELEHIDQMRALASGERVDT